ncbi:MAG: cation:proton antiporter [Aeromicrobium sp.]|nr:MAG: cation:proton antiporter [Aeromicrobium sp.]
METARVLIELGAVIFGLSLLGRFALRIGFSPIPLYLLAGLMFGVGGMLPLSASDEFISIGAEVGVILLLLMLGLEFSADELVTNLRTQLPSGLVDFVMNATPGAVVAFILGWPLAGIVAMAGVTYATSSGIAAKLLSDLGRLGNRETPVVLSLLVFEDLFMAVYLPILTSILAAAGMLTGAINVFVAIAAVGFVFVVALKFGGPINKLADSSSNELLLLGVFGFVLIVAGVAERLNVSTAVGAFLVGIAFSGKVAENLREQLTPLRDLFAAVFFVFFGLETNPQEIPPVLLAAIALAIVTTITKVGVGMRAARLSGVALPGQIRAGTILVPRGEFSIVVAGLAASAGVAGINALAAAYVMIVAILGTALTRFADPIAYRIADYRDRKASGEQSLT